MSQIASNFNLDITSANAVATLTVDEIYPAGVQLEYFSTDSALAMDQIEFAETRMGVDGHMVAGFTPVIKPLTITLEASSPSTASLITLREAMEANSRLYICNLVCTMRSIGYVFTFSRGVLQAGTPFPSMQRVLAPTTWVFNFGRLETAKI